MVEKKALGKGLKALIGEPEEFARYGKDSVWQDLLLEEVEPNPFQPREDFDDEKLTGLVASIKANGVLQPVIVRRAGNKYQLIAGERRWRAARKAGLMTIPAIVRDATEQDMLKLALIENLQRQDLNPIEEATAYKSLTQEFGLTQEALAARVGKDRSSVANTMRLLALPPEIQAHVSRGTLSMGHARCLLAVTDPAAQLALCVRAVKEGLSVRQMERLARASARKRPPVAASPDPNLRRLEEELQRSLGAKVRVRSAGKRGKIEIEFYSPDEFEALVDRLLGLGERRLR